MLPSEYEVQAHRRELLLHAEQYLRARQLITTVSPLQQVGQLLLRLGAHLTARQAAEWVTVEAHGQVITVCSAATCTA